MSIPLSSPQMPLPGLGEHPALEGLGQNVLPSRALPPTPRHCSQDLCHALSRVQSREDLSCLWLQEDAQRGQPRDIPHCLQLLRGCSAWALLPSCPAVQFPDCLEMLGSSITANKRVSRRDANPRQRLGDARGPWGCFPLVSVCEGRGGGKGSPVANPHRPSGASSQQCVFESWLC